MSDNRLCFRFGYHIPGDLLHIIHSVTEFNQQIQCNLAPGYNSADVILHHCPGLCLQIHGE